MADRDQARVRVDIDGQRLALLDADGTLACEFPVSTAAAGAGERRDSGCTPRGGHRIRARIGLGAPLHTVFVGRRPTGEIWSAALAAAQPGRDWILGRILWLCGCEPGRNRLGDVDTMRRYIYIHGSPPTEPMGVPRSHGCIRMCCDDVARLCDLVRVGTRVEIL
jgi:hypothetical protein